MKKIFLLILTLVFSLSLCACGAKIQKGTYKATAFSADGETVEGDEVLEMFKDFSIEIVDGSTAQMGYGDQKQSVNYTLNGDNITLGNGMTGTYKDGKINLSFGDDGDGFVVFEKVQ